jgi:hypothetical protein
VSRIFFSENYILKTRQGYGIIYIGKVLNEHHKQSLVNELSKLSVLSLITTLASNSYQSDNANYLCEYVTYILNHLRNTIYILNHLRNTILDTIMHVGVLMEGNCKISPTFFPCP